MGPLVFEPLLYQIRWGGRKLGTLLNKPIGAAQDYAESWELADHANGQSVVARGPLTGITLSELVRHQGPELLGVHSEQNQFPLLIKFLDANDWLSLQVHPNDRQAVSYNPSENGKTEAWVILDAEPGSEIICGLKPGVTREQLAEHLHAGTVSEIVHRIPAAAGDCFYVPAGTVHALGPGIVLAEVQQQSNLTFRLHDWGRLGSDGKPRPIHVQESLDCTDYAAGPVDPVTPRELGDGEHCFEELVRCQHFVIRRHQGINPFHLKLGNRFRILMLLEGSATLSTNDSTSPTETLKKGETTLLPACLHEAHIHPESAITLLEILLP
ncbi:MAG: type I phosphomannose isomerase catalytic subunit [Planctomycetaceae bacterium]